MELKYTIEEGKKYKRKDIARMVAERADFIINDVDLIFDAFTEVVTELCQKNCSLAFRNLFFLETYSVKARKGYLPQYERFFDYPAARRIRIRASYGLKKNAYPDDAKMTVPDDLDDEEE